MAWVSGVFSRLHNWVNDRDANIKILATRHDAEDDNLAAGINNTLTKDGQNTATANLPMGNFRHTGVGNAAARTDYTSAAQIQDSGVVYVADTGTADVYAISLSPAITAYVTGNLFWFKAANTNTGASTLNVNGVGAKSIVRTVSTALIADDIKANGIYGVFYDGTNFQLVTPDIKILAKDHGTKAGNFTLQLDEAELHLVAFSAVATLTIASTKTNDKATVVVKNGANAITLAGIDVAAPTLTNAASTQDLLAIVKSFGKTIVTAAMLNVVTV